MTLSLPAFYTRHHARLRKWLPEGFFVLNCDLLGKGFGLNYGDDGCVILKDDAASIFLERAARRALEEEGCRLSTWKDGSVRTDHPVFGARASASSVHQSDSHLLNLAAALDTLFPEETNNV